MKRRNYIFILLSVVLFINCSQSETVKMVKQKTGPLRTNCYLIYGPESKEAALIDVGSNIDSLVSFISDNELNIKYILITHCHPDHIKGIPAIKELYPDAKLGFTKQEFDDMKFYEEWETIFGEPLVKAWSADSVMSDLMNYDYGIIGEPDIYLKDNALLKLGYNDIRVLETPGHSRGSASFAIGNYLFTGDLLFYHSDGNMDCTLSSMEDIMKSMKRLYEEFPDTTVIFPGHFRETDIAGEKKENRNASYDKVKNL